jgi:LPXTG-motif cell wall-anchored protein
MSTLSKFFWAFLAGLVLLWVGGGTPVEAHNQKFTATCETLVIKLDSYQVKKGDSFSNVADLEIDGVHYNSYPFNKSTTITVEWPLADFHSWALTVDAYNTNNPKHEGPFVGSFSGECIRLEPVVPEVTLPTCDAPGYPIPNLQVVEQFDDYIVTVEAIRWVEEEPYLWVAYANDGFYFRGGVPTVFNLSPLTEADGCVSPTTVPPTTVPPTTVPPTTVVVATGLPPVPPTTVAPTGTLPATGASTTPFVVTIAAIALVFGLLLAYASRRNSNIKLPWRND